MTAAFATRLKMIAFFIAAAFVLYGRSLPYEFVYDDHWRVEQNPAVRTLRRADRFFWDRTTNASLPMLHRDSYRPIVTLSYALDAVAANGRPGFFRFTNICCTV